MTYFEEIYKARKTSERAGKDDRGFKITLRREE